MTNGQDRDSAHAVWTLLTRLEPLAARALTLSYARGLTQVEIARELDLPRPIVSRLIASGLHELAAILIAADDRLAVI